jgi:hypothetical protein
MERCRAFFGGDPLGYQPSGATLKKGEKVALIDQEMGWTFIIYNDHKFGIIRTGNINDCQMK